jgi:hypothetical protein
MEIYGEYIGRRWRYTGANQFLEAGLLRTYRERPCRKRVSTVLTAGVGYNGSD